MCRSIKPLFNYDPPATDEEITLASLQFVRKLSGFTKPSQQNEKAFYEAVENVALVAKKLFKNLSTNAKPRNREMEAQKVHKRAIKRFGI